MKRRFFRSVSKKDADDAGRRFSDAIFALEETLIQVIFSLFSKIPLEKMNGACYINSFLFL